MTKSKVRRVILVFVWNFKEMVRRLLVMECPVMRYPMAPVLDPPVNPVKKVTTCNLELSSHWFLSR